MGGVLLSLASVASAQEARLADAAERQGSAAVRALLADGADPNLGPVSYTHLTLPTKA
mgnify:CR=1 FL=1